MNAACRVAPIMSRGLLIEKCTLEKPRGFLRYSQGQIELHRIGNTFVKLLLRNDAEENKKL